MSAFGVGESLAKASRLARQLYRGGKVAFADKAAGESVLTASGLDHCEPYEGTVEGARRR